MAYRRADGQWVAVLEMGDLSGVRRRRAFYGKTAAIADAKRDAARHQGIPEDGSQDRLSTFLRRWHKGREGSLSPTTVQSYQWVIDSLLIPRIGHIKLINLRPMDVELCTQALQASYSPRTVQYSLAVLRKGLGQAQKWGLIHTNPALMVDPPRQTASPATTLSREDARRVLEATRGTKWHAAYALALGIGMRRGEILGARWEDVCLDIPALAICRQVVRAHGRLLTLEPKRDSRRDLILPEMCVEALLAHGPADEGWIFTTSSGGPMDPRNMNRHWDRLRQQLGIEARFHDLRHTAATTMLSGGLAPKLVQRVLGHASFRTTMDVYAHVLNEDMLALRSHVI